MKKCILVMFALLYRFADVAMVYAADTFTTRAAFRGMGNDHILPHSFTGGHIKWI